jgi:hypothetical protein
VSEVDVAASGVNAEFYPQRRPGLDLLS